MITSNKGRVTVEGDLAEICADLSIAITCCLDKNIIDAEDLKLIISKALTSHVESLSAHIGSIDEAAHFIMGIIDDEEKKHSN